jgi:hypothetical protein
VAVTHTEAAVATVALVEVVVAVVVVEAVVVEATVAVVDHRGVAAAVASVVTERKTIWI